MPSKRARIALDLGRGVGPGVPTHHASLSIASPQVVIERRDCVVGHGKYWTLVLYGQPRSHA
jgi:hypothetical protein